MRDNNIRIYIDLEYCFPGMSLEYGRPTEKDLRQVVQIAAIKYDTKIGEEVAAMVCLTKPAYTDRLPVFFTELTRITQEELDENAEDFLSGYQKLLSFSEGYEDQIYTFDNDWQVLKQNLDYVSLPFDFQNTPFIRVKPLLSAWGIDANEYSSGTLYKAAKLDMDGHVHNALHDVRSMAAAVHYFENLNGKSFS